MRGKEGCFRRRLTACLGIGIVTVISIFLTGCQTESLGKGVNQQVSDVEGKIQADQQEDLPEVKSVVQLGQVQEKAQKEPIKEGTIRHISL